MIELIAKQKNSPKFYKLKSKDGKIWENAGTYKPPGSLLLLLKEQAEEVIPFVVPYPFSFVLADKAKYVLEKMGMQVDLKLPEIEIPDVVV